MDSRQLEDTNSRKKNNLPKISFSLPSCKSLVEVKFDFLNKNFPEGPTICIIAASAALVLGSGMLVGRADPPYRSHMMLKSPYKRSLTTISGMSSELLGNEKSQSFALFAL